MKSDKEQAGDEARDNLLRELSADLTRLTERVEALEDRQPAGWSPSNYTCDADPRLSLARNTLTGNWSVWNSDGQTLAAGVTPMAAVHQFLRERK